ncbi:hypothetical protein H9638_01950 [Arthrobacter sp. Sa2BUA2]|uniref:DUF6916 domain-containing protein n=1 Tax=Arthrobacter pullicola TaxID=2762224 RepID=A0ABR8YEM7_9MICC|nr:hypothetical protein [Arthrobacter pullicola]MBD8042566.1 hypothetical protein [Arthrobacter pullicola]
MTPPTGPSRRIFLAGTAALAAVAAGGVPARAAAGKPDPYAAQTWEPLVGEPLSVGGLQVRLADVERSTAGFRLTMESDSADITEGLHRVHHPGIGPVDLFLTSHGQRALAVFTHLPKGL